MNSNQRILVVEDDLDGQALVAHILEYLNFPIDLANDAEQAAEYLFNSGTIYQAVIIDLALPGKDGWELLSQIRSEPATASIPCIAVTAFHTSKVREEALRSGFSVYFSKPLDATVFAHELEVLLH